MKKETNLEKYKRLLKKELQNDELKPKDRVFMWKVSSYFNHHKPLTK